MDKDFNAALIFHACIVVACLIMGTFVHVNDVSALLLILASVLGAHNLRLIVLDWQFWWEIRNGP